MASTMFHIDDLNSGINKALAESKLVACFVTNGNEESRLWENDFLQDPELNSQLQERTVLLRLVAGSEEANYLAAIFPIPKVPTLVAIWNGELKEYLAAGITKDEFLTRLGKALESANSRRNVENDRFIASNGTRNPEQRTTEGQDQRSSGSSPAGDRNIGSTPAFQSTHSNPVDPSSSGSLPIDPRGNIPKDNKAIVEDHPKHPNQTGDTTSYAAMQKKLQQEAREERARILALVESDKARRRKNAERKAKNGDQLIDQSTLFREKTSSALTPASEVQDCALQIRLFDGSSIRSRFSNATTLSGDVRKWIDDYQKDDVPYIFKQICTPLPNRTLSMTDESRDLTSLGLYPSATLIIVPVQAYTSAYEATEPSSILSRGIAAGYSFGTWGIDRMLATLGGIVGGTAVAPDTDQRAEPGTSAVDGRASSLSTLRDRNDNDDHREFYNGNTLNFEPRKDDPHGDH
ncbi:hypothetical protein SBOR_9952 [Sclerotinia borealis F-4128]|uniref:UBX domain-containing protein 2 n=1 Tax=Sclerotinia borealis (strain F-4128) TaxID=1432307 RepID=W9C189_SCLBF|nr:hypothetical protein SBOR_9952 [Sclerotinia borealis F-4128]